MIIRLRRDLERPRAGSGAPVRRQRLIRRVVVCLLAIAFVAAGLFGAGEYGVFFWRYRGFPPPSAPAAVISSSHGGRHVVQVRRATVVHLTVRAPSLGGWNAPVDVVLPPGYDGASQVRYPVLYLLHGFPGEASNFFSAGDLLPTFEVLLAEQEIRPMILVLPESKEFFADTEWANGVQPDSGWETFVSDTLVRAIDGRYRTIRTASGRGIAGLSEGGYGALNIGLQHPSEYSLLESWSGYETADDVAAIFGKEASLLHANSPMDEVQSRASALRDHHVYIWMYVGSDDPALHENQVFSEALTALGVAHRMVTVPGTRHSWALWREMMAASLISASEHLAHG